MKYDIRRTTQFKKDFELVRKRGLDIEEFKETLINSAAPSATTFAHIFLTKFLIYAR